MSHPPEAERKGSWELFRACPLPLRAAEGLTPEQGKELAELLNRMLRE